MNRDDVKGKHPSPEDTANALDGVSSASYKNSSSSVSDSRRLVVKIGSSTLTTSDSSIDHDYLNDLAAQINEVREAGWQTVIVTSAAIACGLEALGMSKRPNDMPSLQAAASVGQSALAASYAQAFSAFNIMTSTVLLTRRDTADRKTYLHARDTLDRLLDLDVVPIVNENDTVSVEQIRFGDNDTLAALVACLIDADLLVMLSDVDGLYDADPSESDRAHLIERVEHIDESLMACAKGSGTTVGSGGMITKMKAARILMVAGIPMIVCNGHRDHAIVDATKGLSIGTLFVANKRLHEITPKKLWIALGDTAHGAVVVDDGAREALIDQGSSLLCVGVCDVEGQFDKDDIIDIKDNSGSIIARGKVAAASDVIELACGMPREAMEHNRLLADLSSGSLIHRDDLVVFV